MVTLHKLHTVAGETHINSKQQSLTAVMILRKILRCILQDICVTILSKDIRGTLFNVTKGCRRYSECESRGVESCEIIGNVEYCTICEEAPPTCPQRMSHNFHC